MMTRARSLLAGGLLAASSLSSLSLVACNKGEDTGQKQSPVEGPLLVHTPPVGDFVAGGTISLDVEATDPDGVLLVTLNHRTADSTYWDYTVMTQGEGDLFTAVVTPTYVPGLEYYFEASDGGASTAYSSLPEAGPAEPFRLDLRAASVNLPWAEDFELEANQTSLFTLGWWAPSEDFDAYAWEVSPARARSGATSAFHGRTPPEVGAVRDWLVSPALNFSSLPEIMVTWYESGQGTPAMGTHSLYVSTGSRFIEDGDFVPVVEALDRPPEGGWARSQAVDLSAYAGAPEVYLAWVYEGSGDDWYIDDISVGPLKADLDASLSWDPDPVHPGETATVTVVFDNSTPAGTTNLSATLTLPEGGGVVAEETLPVPDVDGDGSTSVSFELALDPSLHDNRYLPLHVSLTDGTDTWEYDLQMTVGLPSSASLDIEPAGSSTLSLIFGVGDPASPTAAISAYSGSVEAGAQVLQADITDYYDLLPPGPGPDRWFAKVTTSITGPATAFSVTYDGVTYTSEQTGNLGGELILQLPPPPSPRLVSRSPNTARPGDAGLPVTVVVTNDGYPTAGPVTATLRSLSPTVTVNNGSGILLSSVPWEGGQSLSLTGPTLDIGSNHDRSQPALLELALDDGLESWTLSTEVPVPWPVFNIIGTAIDDSGGDGVLDAGESATLTLLVANTGDLDSFGRLTGELSIASSSTATASLTSSTGNYFTIVSGGSRDEDFDIEVTGGADGDTLDLELLLTDTEASYLVTTTVVLGTPPWQAITPVDDNLRDNLNSYGFDIQRVWYRIDGSRIDLLMVSDVPYDPVSVFIEAWGTSSGASWDFYRWVVQPGAAGMYGYRDGDFQPIGDVDTVVVSSTELMISWNTDDMDLIVDRLSLGFAAGWCGPPTYFCDHYPDGWGWPYDGTSFNMSRWFALSW